LSGGLLRVTTATPSSIRHSTGSALIARLGFL
jgi:hypothetical protein